MEIRALDEHDLSALLELCRQVLPLDTFSLPLLRTRGLGQPNHNPRYHLAAWSDRQLAGVILGGTRDMGDGPVGAIQMMAVASQFQRQGFASVLLGELQDRMRADGIRALRVGGIAPNYFWPGLDIRYTPAFCFLQKQGFTRTGDAVNMDVDLASRDWSTDALEMRLADEGFAFRRLQPDDQGDFGAWLREYWGAAWHAEGMASYGNDPISTFVATHDRRICAFASYNVAAFDGGFGPTGTEPRLQGRGLGRILLFRCLQDLQEQGLPKAEICWTGPISFYARTAGAVMSRTFWTMEKQL